MLCLLQKCCNFVIKLDVSLILLRLRLIPDPSFALPALERVA